MSDKLSKEDWDQLETLMWRRELDSPKRNNRLIAAERICEIAGVAEPLKAISGEGALAPVPQWPECSIHPTGGGLGVVRCRVATLHKGRKLYVDLGIATRGGKYVPGTYQDDVAEALERGKFELRQMIAAKKHPR